MRPSPSHGDGMSDWDEQPAPAVLTVAPFDWSAWATLGAANTAQTAAARTQIRAVDMTR